MIVGSFLMEVRMIFSTRTNRDDDWTRAFAFIPRCVENEKGRRIWVWLRFYEWKKDRSEFGMHYGAWLCRVILKKS